MLPVILAGLARGAAVIGRGAAVGARAAGRTAATAESGAAEKGVGRLSTQFKGHSNNQGTNNSIAAPAVGEFSSNPLGANFNGNGQVV
jgi:hypothetical protein